MGMLDSIGDLGGLGRITKKLGSWAVSIKQGGQQRAAEEHASSATRPAALFDVNTGNLLGAAQLGMEAMKRICRRRPKWSATAGQSREQQTKPGSSAGRARDLDRRRHRHLRSHRFSAT